MDEQHYGGAGVAQLVERRTPDPMDSMTRVRTPSGAQEKPKFVRTLKIPYPSVVKE